MVKNGQKIQVCIDGEPTKNAEVLERIERDYGVVYEVQLEGGNETMVVNESQLLSSKTEHNEGKSTLHYSLLAMSRRGVPFGRNKLNAEDYVMSKGKKK